MACFNIQQLYQKMRERMSPTDEEEPPLNVKCIHCTWKERVHSFQQLARGCHIQLKGENFRFNLGDRQIGLYTHHAIVKGVKIIDNLEAELNLIEFISTPYDSSLKIRETRGIKTLKNDDIYIIRYQHKTHSADEIIRRAESFVAQCQSSNSDIKYSLMTCNCEHFCHWCCTGNEDSYQVHDVKETVKHILQGSANIGGKILRVVLKVLFLSADELTKAVGNTLLYLPWGVLGVFGLIYLVYCIHSHMKLNKQKMEGTICTSCCHRLKTDMWLRLAIYAVTQSGGLGLMSIIMAATASNGIVFGALGLVTIISLGTMWLVPKLRNKLYSPFRGKKVRVKTMQNIWLGDVISFSYKHRMHDAVVTAAFPDKTNSKKGRISVVHYSSPSVFGRRKIIEEDISIDNLDRKVILGHVYDPEVIDVHDPEVVVERARKRIGETKFGVLSNRSCHFCHWAKVVQKDVFEDEEITQHRAYEYNRELLPQYSLSGLESLHVDHRPGRKHATKTLACSWAKIRDDIKPGQLIEFKLYWRFHKAVVTEVQYAKDKLSKLSITVVHYGEMREVTEDTYTFDLNETDIWIYKRLSMYKSQDIIRRARARIGEKKYNAITHNSSHLCKEIVEKSRDPLISHFDDIQPGNAIIFYYWSLKHAAIVTKVHPDESKGNTSGSVSIVHYALPHIFATRTILEEELPMDLNKDHIYKMKFDGCVQYPRSKIIKRAKDRIGEKRFSILGNTSWDFVQWAAVVQRPVIVDEVVYQRGSPGRREVRERLLLPKVKTASDKFQKVVVQSWDDLKLGDIVEYVYYWIDHQGIVSDIDAKRNKVKVIHYGASHIFAVRTIVEDTLDINLKRKSLKVYLTDPRECHKSNEIVKQARRRLGEKDWRPGNRSWDMCIQCVFKSSQGRSSSK